MSRAVNRFCCIALFLMTFSSMAGAVRVQGIEWATADDYQVMIVNAYRQRIARASASPVSTVGSDPQLFLISFAKRVDARDMLAEAESYGVAAKEIHVSIGESHNAFAMTSTVQSSEQIAQLQTNLLGELSDRALELKQKIDDTKSANEKSRRQRVHWWKEELKAIEAFQHTYGTLPLVANGVEVAGSAASVDRFVTSTRSPVMALEPSSVGSKQFAIPLDVYRDYREGE